MKAIKLNRLNTFWRCVLFSNNGALMGIVRNGNLLAQSFPNPRRGIAICGSTGKSGVRSTLGWRFGRLGWGVVSALHPMSNAVRGANTKHAVELLRQSVLILLLKFFKSNSQFSPWFSKTHHHVHLSQGYGTQAMAGATRAKLPSLPCPSPVEGRQHGRHRARAKGGVNNNASESFGPVNFI